MITALLLSELRPTTIYFSAAQLKRKKAKYGDRLRILGEMEQEPAAPGTATVVSRFGELKTPAVKPVPTVEPAPKGKAKMGRPRKEKAPYVPKPNPNIKPIVCLSTGQYFAHVVAAAKGLSINRTSLYEHLYYRERRGKVVRKVGGYTFRYATQEEIKQQKMIG